jgi:uncharacterized protein (UPF0548 family)
MHMGFRLLASDETAALGALKLTYPEVGASMTALPARYHHIHQTASIGTGAAAQTAMADALLQWKMHVRAKLEVAASHELVVPGAVVVLGFSYGPARVTAPCRVVSVVDEPYRRGFAYGTLPGHPECGEEAFLVELDNDNSVRLTVRGFSRSATSLAKLGGPVTRSLQHRVIDSYFRALTSQ